MRGKGAWEGAAGAGDGDDRGHGDTGERTGLHHGGGGAGREGDGVAEGEGEGDTDTAEAVPEAAEVREGEGDKERGGVRDQEREGRVAGAGVARDEGALPEGGRGGGKVFPHNLRHMFATVFYRASRDIVKLADVLGHSSIETTRIYLIATGEEHSRQMNRLELVM